ncbi:universal stress protein [Pelomicrobium methylotrophicum]|jgi:nucleotide-binding universal stress UspA family protein|uniref:Universal stress protein n=1 Tax=Pelomicrobium methylotrophicum TaxID=2602750 RepID=A0A5C7EEZ8_9PROT|nr:universal stress protein [Pelomicrobium methylotrophicum]TXF10444.1 universal stress protein [Pelomicrobium methylotrophicum]
MIKKILLAFDGSEPSRKAFDFAADMASRYQAELYVLTVAQVPEFGEDVETEAVIEHSRLYHARLLHGLRDRVDRLGIKAQLEMVVGHPAQQILDHAEERGVDLIILGHRGRGMLDRWRLGSVTHRVISDAECAVTVVR